MNYFEYLLFILFSWSVWITILLCSCWQTIENKHQFVRIWQQEYLPHNARMWHILQSLHRHMRRSIFCTLKYHFFYDLELDPCINTIYSLNMFTCKNQTVIINLSVPSLNMIKTSAFHFFNVGVYNHKWNEGSILECCPHFVESMLTWKRGCTRLCKGFDWFLWYTEINCPRNLWWFKMSDGNILVFFCRHVNCLYVFYELGIWK